MERLQKIIALSGYTSRRKAEDLIKAGKVMVNGKVVRELGTKANFSDDILIDGNSSQDIGGLVLKDRELLSDNGIVIICATLDKQTKEILAYPQVLTKGFIYVRESTDLINEMKRISLEVINENTDNNYVDYNKIKLGIRERLSNYLYDETECKPMIITVIQEV